MGLETMTLDETKAAINRMLLEVLDGWCWPEKAEAMAELIFDLKPGIVVEIGVFGGRSLLSQALALQALECGLCVGIDPWRRESSCEGETGGLNEAWWKNVELDCIHNQFLGHLWRLNLQNRCLIIRSPAEHAAALFADGSIDIFHCDANHSEMASCRDVNQWFPKLKPGGYFWMDDTHWASTQKAVSILDETLIKVRDIGTCRLYRKHA